MTTWKSVGIDLSTSGVATLIAEIATLPICTLKTNYQNHSNNHSLSIVFKEIYTKHGIWGFYRGSSMAIISQILSTTSKYAWYQVLNSYFAVEKTSKKRFLTGALSGILASAMTHPFDVVKIHYQMQTPFLPELRKFGPKLFYRGYSKTVSKGLVGSTLFFPLYDIFYGKFNNHVYSSFCSAIISTIIMQPIDYMKVRNIYNLPFYNGINPLNYTKGITLNLARVVPHFVITMSCIEFFKKTLS